jgi:hypothetical protein
LYAALFKQLYELHADLSQADFLKLIDFQSEAASYQGKTLEGMKSVRGNMDVKQIVESDRKITKEALQTKLQQLARARQEQMLFELYFLRDVVDESLRIET